MKWISPAGPYLFRCLLLAGLLQFIGSGLSLTASAAVSSAPLIAIIIDDLGNQRVAGERAVHLPGPVACAIMPHTAWAEHLAEQANQAGKEVMLHLPMQAVDLERAAGPGNIHLDMSRERLRLTLTADLAAVPHTVGINNHMGSLITRHPGHMQWLMEEIRGRGDLFFIDSYTTAASVALQTAIEQGVPAARRHVFLDNDAAVDIEQEFARLKRLADKQGYAIAIGHPYPATLAFLEAHLPRLQTEGYRLVPVSEIVRRQSVELAATADSGPHASL